MSRVVTSEEASDARGPEQAADESDDDDEITQHASTPSLSHAMTGAGAQVTVLITSRNYRPPEVILVSEVTVN